MENHQKSFNFDKANLADQLTVVGESEHLYMHACKSAAASPSDEAVFYQALAEMAKDFRRSFTKKHFKDVGERDWCLIKTVDSLRQRVYESADTDYEALKKVNELWATTMEHIFGIDMSGCVACASDKENGGEMSIQIENGPRVIFEEKKKSPVKED